MLRRVLRVLLLASLASCNVTEDHVASVEVPGLSQAERLVLAEVVVTRAWRGGLHSALAAAVPELDRSQLEQFEVRWVTLEGGSSARVRIDCVFSTSGGMGSLGRRVVQECKRFLEGELARSINAPSPP